jgi:hypothetical protein
MTALSDWQNFYVIMGSSAGALIGLQFVVVALIANIPNARPNEEAGSAFATPNIVHFGTVLLLAGIATAPWPGMRTGPILWVLVGMIGALYSLLVTRRMRRQDRYEPEFEDWLCYSVLPVLAYAGLIASGCAGFSFSRLTPYGVAVAVLLLLFTGIHNAWDSASYHVFAPVRREEGPIHSQSPDQSSTDDRAEHDQKRRTVHGN